MVIWGYEAIPFRIRDDASEKGMTIMDQDTAQSFSRSKALASPESWPAPRLSEKAAKPEGRPCRGCYSSFRILLAEDDLVNQTVGRTILEYFGCRTDVAGNGLEAVEAVAGAAYDLVLMDCQMPLMDGYEATRAIREREAASGARLLPIVALTAHAMDSDREICLEAGMDDYLGKPYKTDELNAILAKWLVPVPLPGKKAEEGAAEGRNPVISPEEGKKGESPAIAAGTWNGKAL